MYQHKVYTLTIKCNQSAVNVNVSTYVTALDFLLDDF